MFSEEMLLSLLVAAAKWSKFSAACTFLSSKVFVRQFTFSRESFRRRIMRDVVFRVLRMMRSTIIDRCLVTSNGVSLPIDGDRARFPCTWRDRRCHSLDPPPPKTMMINDDGCCNILLVCCSLRLPVIHVRACAEEDFRFHELALTARPGRRQNSHSSRESVAAARL